MSDSPAAFGWRVSFQDYKGWRESDFKQPHPIVETRDYPTHAEARNFADGLKIAGLTVTVSPIPPPKRRNKYGPDAFGNDELFNKTWTLTR